MPAAGRTYWLTEPCRIRREDNSLRVEKPDGTAVRLPITDVRDVVTFDNTDVNTAVVSLLGRHGVTLHVLDHYGNYAGSLEPAADMSSAQVVRRQVELTADPAKRLAVARAVLAATAANVRWALDTDLLDAPLATLTTQIETHETAEQLMGAEGSYRRSAWAVLDTLLPPWLRRGGRRRRPPANAGNAFGSYANSLGYARVLTA
nr:CRISPR-associated endonuclease Cas1 [Micromonospora sp. DSM 115978]